jgi:hypothetical protein
VTEPLDLGDDLADWERSRWRELAEQWRKIFGEEARSRWASVLSPDEQLGEKAGAEQARERRASRGPSGPRPERTRGLAGLRPAVRM